MRKAVFPLAFGVHLCVTTAFAVPYVQSSRKPRSLQGRLAERLSRLPSACTIWAISPRPAPSRPAAKRRSPASVRVAMRQSSSMG